MTTTVSKKGKKNRKIGRASKSPSHQKYNDAQRWVLNKAKRIAKHLKKFPNWKPCNVNPLVMAKVNKLIKA